MPRISYVGDDAITDPEVRASIHRAHHTGTPRPEIQMVMAHIPETMKRFDAFWFQGFKAGVVDHDLKELVRVRIATSLECEY